MKKTLLSLFTLCCIMSSCNNEEIVSDVISRSKTIIKAVIEEPAISRSAVDVQTGAFSWTDGDVMKVNTTSGLKDFTYDSSTNEFGCTDEVTVGGYAIYPSTVTYAENVVTLPASYELGATTGNVNAVMLATDIEEGAETFNMKHLGGVVCFSFKDVPVGADKLVFTADNTITGEFTINTDQIEAPATKVETNNIVTLNFTATTSVQDMNLFIPVPVGSYVMKVALYAGETLIYKKEGATSNDVERTTLLLMPEVDCDDFWYDESLSEYTINSVAQLKEFRDMVNSGTTFSGKTVKLGTNLDLDNEEWTPIGPAKEATKQFKGIFDGNDKTISNLKVEGTNFVGLFGYIEHDATTIKNLNLSNVNISGNHYLGAVAGYAVGAKIDKCVVDGGTIIATPILLSSEYDDGDKVGGITGYTGANTATTGIDHNTNITNCEVKNLQISAYRDLGGIAGYAKSAKIVFTGNKVTDCILTADQSPLPYNGTKPYNVNTFIGSFDGTPASSNTSSNVTINKIAMTITTADELMAFATNVNNGTSYVGEIVKLGIDIDMTGKNWTPIGNSTTNFFKGTFDGCDKTISKLNCEGTEYLGLFGYIQYNSAYIKNVKLKNVTITGTNYVGAIIGRPLGAKIEKCIVEDGSLTISATLQSGGSYDLGDKVGGIAGYTGSNESGSNNSYTEAVISNCTVKNTTIKGYRDMGGIVGCAENTDVLNNTIDGVTITVDNTYNYKNYTANDKYNVKSYIGRTVGSNVVETGNSGTATINYPN